jgi:hypothetical protein
MVMTRRQQWGILGSVTVVYLVGLGLLAGVISERWRFDTVRTGILRHLDEVTTRARAHAMAREQEIQRITPPSAAPVATVADRPRTWSMYVEVMDHALAQRDLSAAERAWREAYGAAVRTRAWRPLVEVGDAAVRIGAVDGTRGPYVSRARELYLAALTRARADRSIDGVVRVAEAFSALGDHSIVERCLVIAEGLGASADSETIARLRELGHRALDVRATPRVEQ